MKTHPTHDKPLAAPGLTSYRYQGDWGWIMIGAKDTADALREAGRSLSPHSRPATVDRLQIWDGARYIPIESKRDGGIWAGHVLRTPDERIAFRKASLETLTRLEGKRYAENFAEQVERLVMDKLTPADVIAQYRSAGVVTFSDPRFGGDGRYHLHLVSDWPSWHFVGEPIDVSDQFTKEPLTPAS